ncbi:MAG: SPOR domain-containing protein [Pseudomonadota bacterium]
MPAYYDEEEDFGSAVGVAGRSSRGVSRIAGAVAALAVIGGGGYLVWNMGSQDTGEIPVIRAAAGPAKTQPVSAGGEATAHTDVSAFEVAEGENGQAVGTRLAPLPGAPSDEDRAMSQIAAVSAVQPPAQRGSEGVAQRPNDSASLGFGPGPAPLQGSLDIFSPQPAKPSSDGGRQIAALALADETLYPLPEDLEPPRVYSLITSEAELLDTQRPSRNIVVNRDEPVPPVGVGSELAPAYVPFVRARPADLTLRIARAQSERAQAETDLVHEAERSPVQIQLGAFPERQTIEAEWDRLRQANSDVLSGRALAVQQTISGGITYYRLRVGPFRDGHEANTVCQALKVRGYDCLVAINTERRG